MWRTRTIRTNGRDLRRLIDDIIDTGWQAPRYERAGEAVEYDVKMPLFLWRELAEHQAAKDLKAVYQPR